MFEDRTFENILDSMLTYVESRNPDLDTSAGSIIYTALAPIALELETAYHQMDMILDETFVDTASKEYLVKFGNQFGLPINEATFGHFKGEFNVDVPIGSRFNLDEFNYTVVEKLSNPISEDDYYIFELVCETAGAKPNDYDGDLTPINYVEGLSHCEITDVIIRGEDEEETEAYRYRLQVHAKNPPTSGNIFQYNEWLDAYPEGGIGKYKVTPCWNGRESVVNTVHVRILDAENNIANEELVTDVQNYFDPEQEGMGNGVAPIGARVIVETATKVDVDIVDCEIKFKAGYEENGIALVKSAITSYLQSIALENPRIDYMQIMAAIYNTYCVGYVDNLIVMVGDITMNPKESGRDLYVEISEGEIGVLNSTNIRGV